jgi:hypothetical protein
MIFANSKRPSFQDEAITDKEAGTSNGLQALNSCQLRPLHKSFSTVSELRSLHRPISISSLLNPLVQTLPEAGILARRPSHSRSASDEIKPDHSLEGFNLSRGSFHSRSASESIRSSPYSFKPTHSRNQSCPTDLGSPKMDRLQNGTLVQRRCGDCDANNTSGHWSQDPLVVGGYICQKCYRRRKRAEKDSRPYIIKKKSCFDCQVDESVVWFRHFSLEKKYLCSPCHNTKTGIETSSCNACGDHQSTKWFTDLKGKTVCRKCHRESRTVALVLTGFSQ